MLELLLGSEHLILDHEDDTFALITAWADGRPRREREAAFARLWPRLRLHHMSPVFLTSVVAEDEMSAWMGSRRIMDAVAYRSMAASLGTAGITLDRKSPFLALPPGRATKDPAPYHFEARADLEDCEPLEDWQVVSSMMGVTAGYRVTFQVQKSVKPTYLGALTGSHARAPKTLGLYVGLEALSHVAGPALPGPIARVRIEAAGRSLVHPVHAYKLGSLCGWKDFFSKPWEKVVRDGSPYFPHGRMSVKVTIQFLSDKYVEPVVGDLP
jgi:hypothetical protein